MSFRDAPFTPEMIAIPGGRFLMGSPAGVGLPNEGPRHEVAIAPFALGRHLVTFEEWDAFTRAGAYDYSPQDEWGRGRQPAINISWNDSAAYVRWLAAATGKPYRMPTEAEWEYAARAGSDAPYWTGEILTQDQANFAGEGTSLVGAYPPNPFGLYDTAANLWEWTADCWNRSFDGAPADGSAWLSGDCNQKIARGGSWANSAFQARAGFRFRGQAALRSNCMGLRVARDIDG